jgi:membrane-associated phospholipid phosphatase
MAPRKLLFFVAAALVSAAAGAEPVTAPSITGQNGLLNMPDARVAPEGTWRTGISFMRPYSAVWTSLALFPWLEGSFRYTRIMHVPGFNPGPGIDYGDYKDKSFDLKLRLLPERGAWPSLAVGGQDLQGTDIFRAFYGVASKQVGDFDFTLGYGSKRIDGAFGGVRYTDPRLPNWSLVAEYDAYDYKKDHGAALSGAADYRKAPAAGIEYRGTWWGAKLYSAHGEAGVNAWVSVPLEAKEFVPKVDEPPPFTRIVPRPTSAQWAEDREHRARLVRALYEQDFRDVRIAYANGVLSARLTNIRISSMPRAVGRAARTMLSFAPLETREIRVTFLESKLPLATYEFDNVPLLQDYFNGMASRAKLRPTVSIAYAQPAGRDDKAAQADREAMLAAFEEPIPERLLVQHGVEGNKLSLRDEDVLGGTLLLHPSLQTYFNDPSGALKFDFSAVASYERWFPHTVQLLGDVKATVWENVSDVTQPSNSLLPHVRTDVADYKRVRRPKILRLLANKYFQPAQQVYARVSGGIYEEMFDGVGGQVLYLPGDGTWATDLAVDAVKQRDFRGLFGTRDYSTVTAIASLNYRMAHGLTATARVGRFLAKDEGVRFEMKRRFRSGFEVGAWYTFTNGNDITSPGTPSSPYHDKGIFMAMPLDAMLTRDTRAVADVSLSPWTRDVGQMVQSPGDLYSLTERDVIQMHRRDGLSGLGDMDDDYTLPSLGTGANERRWPDFVAGDARGMARSADRIDWGYTALVGGALTLAASGLDTRAYRFAENHRDAKWLKDGVRLGNALPVAALGLSAMFAFDDSRPHLSDAGTAALEAGAVGLLASEGLKYALGRARPTAGLGKAEFSPGAKEDKYHSFPSNHTVLMWAAITPYAEEYDNPWLYGVAALTNLARIGSREHWVSDTVASSIIGYGLGYLAWNAQHRARLKKDGPTVLLGPQSVNLAWQLN